MSDYLQLQDIVLLGRTFDEYCGMFRLDHHLLADQRIVDVAAGVSSFTAEARTHGYDVTASDRIYAFRAEDIERKCGEDLRTVIEQLPDIASRYVWNLFPNVDALAEQRERAYRRFIADFRQHGSSRYVSATYPHTAFADGQFTLALSSHFLFLYEDHLDFNFHKQTILEIMRITVGEARFFPLVNLRSQTWTQLDRLLGDPDLAKFSFTIERVGYEFIKNGHEMLVIRWKT